MADDGVWRAILDARREGELCVARARALLETTKFALERSAGDVPPAESLARTLGEVLLDIERAQALVQSFVDKVAELRQAGPQRPAELAPAGVTRH